MNEKINEYIFTAKNEYYLDFSDQLESLIDEYMKTDEYTMIRYNEDLVDGCKFYYFYSNNSMREAIKLLMYIRSNWTPRGVDNQVYSKRINDNTLLIRFGSTCNGIIMKHLFHDFNIMSTFIEKYVNFIKIIKLHDLIHSLCFPDIYKLFREDIDKLDNRRNNLKLIPYKNTKIMAFTGDPDIILSGAFALQKVWKYYKIKYDHLEFIYVGNVYKIIKKLSRKFRYERHMGDFEMRGNWTDFYNKKNSKLVYRIYDGFNYCYNYITLTNGLKVAQPQVILKYLLLNQIYESFTPLSRGNYRYLEKIVQRINWLNIFSECWKTPSVSSYKKYYQRNWGKRPQSFKIFLK